MPPTATSRYATVDVEDRPTAPMPTATPWHRTTSAAVAGAALAVVLAGLVIGVVVMSNESTRPATGVGPTTVSATRSPGPSATPSPSSAATPSPTAEPQPPSATAQPRLSSPSMTASTETTAPPSAEPRFGGAGPPRLRRLFPWLHPGGQ